MKIKIAIVFVLACLFTILLGFVSPVLAQESGFQQLEPPKEETLEAIIVEIIEEKGTIVKYMHN